MIPEGIAGSRVNPESKRKRPTGKAMDKNVIRSAVGEEIRKLADANKQWEQVFAAQKSAASLAALQDIPAFSQMQEAAKNIGSVVLELRNAFQIAYAEPMASFMNEMRIAQVRFGQWVIDNQKQIEQFAKAAPRIRKALESSGEIGHLGWTVTEDMEFPLILHLSECSDEKAADAYMLKHYESTDADLLGIEERLNGVDLLKPFAVGLSQSFTAFRNGKYALVIPFLIMVLEHALRQLDSPRPFPSTDIAKTVKKTYKRLSKDERLAFAMESLVSFSEDHYDQFDSRTGSDGRVRRKGIMHGLQVPPNEKIQVIRLYHVLDTVVQIHSLQEASPLEQHTS